MIHFFKKKPFLQDLIPNNYVDIHSHLLPGIDDGAVSTEDTTKLIKGLKEIGFEKFITTPHVIGEVWKNTKSNIYFRLKGHSIRIFLSLLSPKRRKRVPKNALATKRLSLVVVHNLDSVAF